MDNPDRNTRRAVVIVILATIVLAAAIGIWVARDRGVQPPAAITRPVLPPVRTSTFRNTEPGVAYLGTGACITCHADAHSTYLETAHSKALSDIDLAHEPSAGTFTDANSKKTYRIFHHDGQLIHEESIQTDDGQQLVLAKLPAKYTIGSGRFSRSYLVDIGGFLFESPATWYSARPGWALSPGYESYNPGFQRPVEYRCVFCHAGRVEPVDNSPQRVEFHSLVIDCERCHGPGARHVEKWEHTDPSSVSDAVDDTIVNPAHLERVLHEDICAQCHLHSTATVELPGRRLQDFRPGLWLSDFVTHYGQKTPSEQMQVVGHAEQLRLSPCYQQSETLTCTSCHDPHSSPAFEAQVGYYRAQCLDCHGQNDCHATLESRHADDLADNCITCHMPRSDTEIPHFSFTHHRIGIHEPAAEPTPSSTPSELIPLNDISWQSQTVQDRNLGLAYLQFSDAPGQASMAMRYHQRAFHLLADVERKHPGDSDVQAALARLLWGNDDRNSKRFADLTLQNPNRSPEAEATACYVLGSTNYMQGRPADAIPWLQRTTELRPTADVWHALSECQEQTGDLNNALKAARRAAELGPDRPRFVTQLVKLLKQTGAIEEADDLAARLPALNAYRRQVDQ